MTALKSLKMIKNWNMIAEPADVRHRIIAPSAYRAKPNSSQVAVLIEFRYPGRGLIKKTTFSFFNRYYDVIFLNAVMCIQGKFLETMTF